MSALFYNPPAVRADSRRNRQHVHVRRRPKLPHFRLPPLSILFPPTVPRSSTPGVTPPAQPTTGPGAEPTASHNPSTSSTYQGTPPDPTTPSPGDPTLTNPSAPDPTDPSNTVTALSGGALPFTQSTDAGGSPGSDTLSASFASGHPLSTGSGTPLAGATTQNASSSSSRRSHVLAGAVAGGVIGALLLILCVAIAAVFLYRRWRRNHTAPSAMFKNVDLTRPISPFQRLTESRISEAT